MLTMFYLSRKPFLYSLNGLLLVSIFISIPVFSKELPKQEPGETTKANQHSETYNRGTEDIPVVIQIAPSAPLKIETDHDKDDEKQKAVNEGRIASGTIAIAFFTLLLVGVTGALAIFTLKLWKSTNRLVAGAEQTAEKQLRAYVGCFHIELECPNLTNTRYVPPKVEAGLVFVDFIRLSMKNYGQTPAYDVRAWVNWVGIDRKHRLPIDFAYTDHDSIPAGDIAMIHTQMTLFPTQISIDGIPIPDLTGFQKAHQQLIALYLYGHINYSDIYHQRQATDFCFLYEPWRPIGQRFIPVERQQRKKTT